MTAAWHLGVSIRLEKFKLLAGGNIDLYQHGESTEARGVDALRNIPSGSIHKSEHGDLGTVRRVAFEQPPVGD